jgi:carbamoyltransferase
MYILGISCHYHDAAAALLKDGMLVAAAQEERFSRIKNDAAFPARAIDFCLNQAGITGRELDYAIFYEKPFLKTARLISSIAATFPRSWQLFRKSMAALLKEKIWIKEYIRRHLNLDVSRILFSEHHMSHAASAFFASPFSEAAILTVDGVGEWATATMGHARARWDGDGENRIEILNELRFPHSLGLLYSAVTAFLGFEVNEGEYKVMGMAPFGEPRFAERICRILELREDGSLWLDPAYLSFAYHTTQSFTRRLTDLFGPPRDPKARFVTSRTSLYDDQDVPTARELERNQYYADVAASIQKVTEDVLVSMANYLHRETGLSKLCLAGGVALNCVANYKLLERTPFDEIFVQPAAGDAGGALGAALFAHHVLLGQPRRFVMDHAYWGKAYPEAEIVDTLRKRGFGFEQFDDDDRLLDRVVDELTTGSVLGWYDGAFEWGPRALGARSIIADPRNPAMKDIVNIKIKFREPFRPFAPSVPFDSCNQFFVMNGASPQYPPRFMLYVVPVAAEGLPAITHVDGTSRPQVVHPGVNRRYEHLLRKFGQATGFPVLLNTSFNLKGEPIVASPADALSTFERCGMDAVVLSNCIAFK